MAENKVVDAVAKSVSQHEGSSIAENRQKVESISSQADLLYEVDELLDLEMASRGLLSRDEIQRVNELENDGLEDEYSINGEIVELDFDDR